MRNPTCFIGLRIAESTLRIVEVGSFTAIRVLCTAKHDLRIAKHDLRIDRFDLRTDDVDLRTSDWYLRTEQLRVIPDSVLLYNSDFRILREFGSLSRETTVGNSFHTSQGEFHG
jgi:hypothetical protein